MTFKNYGMVCFYSGPCYVVVRCGFYYFSTHFLSLSLSLSLVLRGRDPAAVTVLLEDSAAVTGVLMAASMLGLAQYTGNTVYDALGSIGIGGSYLQ